MLGVPSACRKVLSGSRAAGWLAAAVAARRRSFSVTACALVTFLVISVSWLFHIWRMSLPGLASIYQRFHTAPHVHCAALKLSSKLVTGGDYNHPVATLGEIVLGKVPSPKGKIQRRWIKGVWLGKLDRDDSNVLGTASGAIAVRPGDCPRRHRSAQS